MRATAIFGRAARLHVRDQARLQVWDRVPWRPSLARAIHLAPPRACGLAAFVADVPPHALGRPSSATVADEPSPMSSALSRALASLHHRGPDHVGSWISPDGRVGLGHTRLSILDLAPTGNQPMTDQSGQVRAVVNGEMSDEGGSCALRMHAKPLRGTPRSVRRVTDIVCFTRLFALPATIGSAFVSISSRAVVASCLVRTARWR